MADRAHTLNNGGKMYEESCETKYGVTNPVFEKDAETWNGDETFVHNGDVTASTLGTSMEKIDKVCM